MNQGVTYHICNGLRCDTVGGVRLGVVLWLNGRSAVDFRMSIDPDRGPAVQGTFNYRCAVFLAGEPGCNDNWRMPVQFPCDGYTPDKCESLSDSYFRHRVGTFYWSHKWSWKAAGHPGFTWNIPNPGWANTEFYLAALARPTAISTSEARKAAGNSPTGARGSLPVPKDATTTGTSRLFWDCYNYTAEKCESPREVKWGHPNGTFYWSHKWSWTAQGHGAIRWTLPHPGDANTEFYRCGSTPNDCHFNL